ncbi:MAG: ATP-binding protein [Candidatus Zixiibacteriota bacterium]
MLRKHKDFQLDIRLGLTLIVMVLLTLNFASHYTLYRVKQSVELETKDKLYEAGVKAANLIQREGGDVELTRAFNEIKLDYSLSKLAILDVSIEMIKNPDDHLMLDSILVSIDSGLTAEAILPLLINQPVYFHKSGQPDNLVLFPAGSGENAKVVVAVKPSALLSSLEMAGRILIYVGILGVIVIIYATLKFARYIIKPFKSLKEKAVDSGRLDESGGDDVSRLIQSYGTIISELKQSEKELLRLNEIITRRADDLEVYNNYVLKSINTGVITLDNEKKISTINRAAAMIFQIEPDSLAGSDYHGLFAEYPGLLQEIDRFFVHGGPVSNRQISIAAPDKREIILGISISLLEDSQSRVIGAWIILNDQTEFIRMREELDLKTRMATLGEMSGGLAHQLRNSIAAIVGFARLVSKKNDTNPEVKQYTDYLLGESLEAELLVARFLDFARPLVINPESIRVGEMLENVVSSIREKHKKISIRLDDSASLNELISGDALFLKQAIANIVDNACRAVDEGGGQVIISVEADEGYVEIRVSDNGCGIPDENREKIFTPFFSGSPSGSGLGLPLARKIINLHEGRLTFESQPGQGTTFYIRLPRRLKTAQVTLTTNSLINS